MSAKRTIKVSSCLQYAINYYVDYDYDYGNSNCTCHPDDYCRCSVITNCRITGVNMNELVKYFCDNAIEIQNDVDEYCVDRLLRHSDMADVNNYSVNISNGYYGQEIDGIVYDDIHGMSRKINNLVKMKDINKIKYVLEKEYGYLLESLEGLTKVDVCEVSKKDLKVGMPSHYLRLKRSIIESYIDYKGILGIYVRDNNQFRIIDGYHRLRAFNESDRKKAKIIVLS